MSVLQDDRPGRRRKHQHVLRYGREPLAKVVEVRGQDVERAEDRPARSAAQASPRA